MLVKVIGFDPVAVFFTVSVELALVFTTISLKDRLEGVMVSVGVVAAAGKAAISMPASSATTEVQNLNDTLKPENFC